MTYGGYANGDRANIVRLLITESRVKGYVQFKNEIHYIDQLGYIGFENTQIRDYLIIYKQEDIKDIDGYCGVTNLQEANFLSRQVEQDLSQNILNGGCKRVVDLATDADYEFYQRYGSGSNTEIIGIVNMIQGLYENDLDLQINISYQNVWTTSSDPYTGNPSTEIGSELLVNELRNYWESNMHSVERDLVHLFTGKDYNQGGVIGRVYEIGTVCRYPDESYGFTKDRVNQFLTTAHEIGHNFSGIHGDGVSCGTTNASIMCQGSKAIPMYFSTASISRLSNFINTYGDCLSPMISGPNTPICSSAPNVYNLINVPSGATITWSATPSNVVTLTPSGNTVSVSRIGSSNNHIALAAEVVTACGSNTVTKDILVGAPLATLLNVTGDFTTNVGDEASFQAYYNGVGLCRSTSGGITEVQWTVDPSGGPVDIDDTDSRYCRLALTPGAGSTLKFSTSGTKWLTVRAKNACGWSVYANFYIDVLP